MDTAQNDNSNNQAQSTINVNGDNNTVIGNADKVILNNPENVILAGEQTKKMDMIPFGDLIISLQDSRLLDEFKKGL